MSANNKAILKIGKQELRYPVLQTILMPAIVEAAEWEALFGSGKKRRIRRSSMI